MPSLAQHKKKLETENVELKQQLADAELRADDAEAAADNAKAAQSVREPLVRVQLDGTAVQTRMHEQAVLEPELLYDPFDSKNPHKITSNPPGFRLGWKNPHYRDSHRGWRGWAQITYDSDVGRNLSKYLLDPPRKMSHQTDNVVRRGDSVLCALPEDMWLARQQARTDRANRNKLAHAANITVDKVTVDDIRHGPQQDHAPGSVGGRTMTS